MRQILRELRVKYDYTQNEMAKRLGITRTTYCGIENGKRKGSLSFWLGVIRAFPEKEAEILAILKEREEHEEQA